MKRIRSGVEAPEANDGLGGARLWAEEEGDRSAGEGIGLDVDGFEGDLGGPERVVLRVAFVVSAEGGKGRWVREEAERMCARQRKHSPVPK